MATVKEFRMSQERYDELKHELEYSKTTRADEIAELIKEARGFGDLSENSEYDGGQKRTGQAVFPHRRAGGDPAPRRYRGRERCGLRSDLHWLPRHRDEPG